MPTYRVFEANADRDRDLILALWRRNLKDTNKLEEKLEWNFKNNPCGEGRLWLLEADGEPVGTTSLGLRLMKVRDRVITVGIACDLAVDPKHRFLQPALMLQKTLLASMKPPIQMVYGFPGAGGAGVLKRVGYQQFCFVDRFAKALKLTPYLQRNRRIAPSLPLVGGILDFSYSMVCSLRERSPAEGKVQILSDFDERFDELWDRCKDRYELATVRSSRFLRWRYKDCPTCRYTIIAVESRDGSRLFGYLIYCIEDNCAVCVDVFVDGNADRIIYLLGQWLRITRGSAPVSAASVMCSGDPELLKALHRLGFAQRSARVDSAGARKNTKEASRALLTYQDAINPAFDSSMQWYFTPGDQPYN